MAAAYPAAAAVRLGPEAQATGRTGAGRGAAALVVAGSAAVYGATAWYITSYLGYLNGDAYSRFANAFYVFFSRDPHLAAIGFVWTPLPSLVEMLFLPVQAVWPGALSSGVAASAMSVAFMAGAVWEVWLILSGLGLRGWTRGILLAAFALNPMVVLWGAVGTSEAPMLFLLLLATHCLAGWHSEGDTRWLVYAGLALALALLTRYEAVVGAVGATAAVAMIDMAGARGGLRRRLGPALADIAILLFPVVVAFGLWTLASWVIVGDAFSQFSSAYGNAAQLRVGAQQGQFELGDPLPVKVVRLLGRASVLQPGLIPAVGAALLLTLRSRDLAVLSRLGVLSAIASFMSLAYVLGMLGPFLRYLIVVIPLGVILTGAVLRRRSPVLRTAMLTLAVAAIPVTALGFLDPRVAPDESSNVRAFEVAQACGQTQAENGAVGCFTTERAVARYVDGLQPRSGSVLIDSFRGFAVILLAHNPRDFVITSDRDFNSDVLDPEGTGIKYLLVPEPKDAGVLDALNRAYPKLYSSGAGIAKLVREFPGRDGSPTWRLYEVGSG